MNNNVKDVKSLASMFEKNIKKDEPVKDKP